MKYLITGGCGFVGTNLAIELIKRNEELIIVDNFYRGGSYENYKWLKTNGSFKFYHCDVRNSFNVESIIKDTRPDVIFHLAGQVAMTTSIKNPFMDFEINAMGSLNVLEAVRKNSLDTIIIYSSTNKVYGDLEKYRYIELEKRYECLDYPEGFDENIPLDFHSPYGCSKGSGDQYMIDYSRIFGIKTVVFRHSSIYGGRQFATYDQGWIGWFCKKAIDIKKGIEKGKITISGNGKQVRDLLFVDGLVDLYFKTVKNIDVAKGQAFNIGGGKKNSLSILELFELLERKLDIKINFESIEQRKSDQKIFIANISKAKEKLKWEPEIGRESGIEKMINWLSEL